MGVCGSEADSTLFRNPEDERRTVTLTGGAYTQDELRRYEISESRKRRLEPVAPADEYEARRRREMPPLTQEVCFSPHLPHVTERITAIQLAASIRSAWWQGISGRAHACRAR